MNDLAGHDEGDRVLRLAADQLGAACRSSDMAFRIGGDEFALLLPETTAGGRRRRGRARRRPDSGREGAGGGSSRRRLAEDGFGKESLLGRR